MQRLILEGTARVIWEEIGDPPSPPPRAALVRPVAIATCDLDVGVLRGRFPLAGPYPFGHDRVHENLAGVTPTGMDPQGSWQCIGSAVMGLMGGSECQLYAKMPTRTSAGTQVPALVAR